ncbi:MAG TPA: hypothetical protein VKA70_13970 [Blastocatellia bacterium]|nr:hypothetical protein [Blastocatellia bacterium]
MRNPRSEKGGEETRLASLMRAAVDARGRLARARERLRSIEERIRGKERNDYEGQRVRALNEYIEAMGKAKRARTELLRQLRARTA